MASRNSAIRRTSPIRPGVRSSTSLSPDGAANPPEAPLDFQLRQELRRHREEVERLEGRLRELEIEANLAGVPEDWRE